MPKIIQNTPKMDIKLGNNGESFSLSYDGEIQIITQNLYHKLVVKAKKYEEAVKELEAQKNGYENQLRSQKEQYELEIARLKNMLKEQKDRAEERYNALKTQSARQRSVAEQQVWRAEQLLQRQGQGRPSRLTEEQKRWIESQIGAHKAFGGKFTSKDFEAELVRKAGYTGGYEPVRAFIAELKKKYGRG